MKVFHRYGSPIALFAMALLVPMTSSRAAAPAAPRPAAGASRLTATLPDSVLARVFLGTGPGQTIEVTRAMYQRAMARFRNRPQPLTPKERRQFLDILVDQRLLAYRAGREPRQWAPRDSEEYNALRDRLVLSTALDSAMMKAAFDRGGRGDSMPSPQQLGIVLRDSAVARLAPVYDNAALKVAAAAFDTMPRGDARTPVMEQMRLAGLLPHLTHADSARVLATSSVGRYTFGDLLRDFGRLNPIYRPRVSTPDQVRDLVNNVLYENMLREAGRRSGYEHRPANAAALAEKAEYLDVSTFVAREVYARIPLDSASVRRYFNQHISDYDLPARANILRMLMERRSDAESMLRRLTEPGQAESLLAQSARAGTPYGTVLTEDADSVLFRRLQRAGVGAVIGPDSLPGAGAGGGHGPRSAEPAASPGFRLIKVLSFEPRRHRPLSEAADLAKQDWYNHEGERRMHDMLDELHRRAIVTVNERAMARLSAGSVPPAPRPPAPGRR